MPSDALNSLWEQFGKYDNPNIKLPPVHLWNPELSGDMDMIIKQDGQWIHEGSPILRGKLTRLFGSILKVEQGEYYLVTPVEKWRIKVEDLPLIIVLAQVEHGVISLITNLGDEFQVSSDHDLEFDETFGAPKVHVRNGLYARLNRSSYYSLTEYAYEKAGQFFVSSNDHEYRIG